MLPFGVKEFVIIGGLVLSVFSLPALYFGIGKMLKYFNGEWESPKPIEKEERIWALLLCIVSAFGVIGVCSKSSFLYPFNDWDDANCFFTVGKAMFNGIVPYRDLFEQKGPLLYALHGFAWIISHDSFLGVYFLESVCATVFLYYSYKTIRLYVNKKAIFAIPLMAFVCYTASAFKDGDSAEEISLPFIAASIYLIVRALREDRDVTNREALIIGALAGWVFWIKFSLIGLYLGWFAVYAFILLKKRKIKKIFLQIAYIAAGVLLASAPFIVYFGLNHSLLDWLKVYIYDNLFLYNDEKANVLGSLRTGYLHFEDNNKIIFNLCLLVILLYLCRMKKATSSCIVMMIVFEFVLIYMGGRRYRYYSFAMNAFIPLGMVGLYRILRNKVPEYLNKKVALCILTVSCILLSLYLSPSRYLLGVDRDELPQFRFAKIMHEKDEDPTLLNYGFLDGGFYTAADILPSCKAFCKLNIDLQEMDALQDKYLKEGLCDFVVSKRKIDSNKYKLIETMTFPYNDTTQTFYLYERK